MSRSSTVHVPHSPRVSIMYSKSSLTQSVSIMYNMSLTCPECLSCTVSPSLAQSVSIMYNMSLTCPECLDHIQYVPHLYSASVSYTICLSPALSVSIIYSMSPTHTVYLYDIQYVHHSHRVSIMYNMSLTCPKCVDHIQYVLMSPTDPECRSCTVCPSLTLIVSIMYSMSWCVRRRSTVTCLFVVFCSTEALETVTEILLTRHTRCAGVCLGVCLTHGLYDTSQGDG